MKKRKLLCLLLTMALAFTSTDYTILAKENSEAQNVEQDNILPQTEENLKENESSVIETETVEQESETSPEKSEETENESELVIYESETSEAESEIIEESEETENESELITQESESEKAVQENETAVETTKPEASSLTDEIIIEDDIDNLTAYINAQIVAPYLIMSDSEFNNLELIGEGFVNLNGYTLITNGNLTINSGLKINGGTVIIKGDAIINNDFDLEGTTVTVGGDVIHTAGTININKGCFEIGGSYRAQTKKRQPDGTYKYIESQGILKMVNDEDLLDIKGGLYIQSVYGTSALENEYKAGTIKVGGDIVQICSDNADNFACIENHKIILNGIGEQKISFASTSSYINQLELQNDEVKVTTPVKISRLLSDGKIESEDEGAISYIDLNGHELEIDGDISINGDTNLNGGKLKLNNNVLHTAGTISFNKGSLEIGGDYRGQTKTVEDDESISYGQSDTKLKMLNAEDVFEIKNDAYFQSIYGSSASGNEFKAGTMKLGGDLVQLYANSANNFACTETHKIVLNGTREQKISFASTNSYINELEFQNENITIISPVKIARLASNGKMKSEGEASFSGVDLNGHTLELDGNVKINGDINLNNGKLKLNDNMLHLAGTISFNKGSLEIEGDYRSQTVTMGEDGTESYNYGVGKLNMSNAEDIFEIKGNVYIQSGYSSSAPENELKAGTMKVGGNFTQLYNTNAGNFACTESHKIVLNGTKEQEISFASTNSYINELEFQNESITLTTPVVIGKLVNNGKIKLKNEGTIAGVDLNGKTLTIDGDLLHSMGTINFNKGTLIVTGDYRNQKKHTDTEGNISYIQSEGKLNMSNAEDVFDIKGDVYIQSSYSASAAENELTAGTMKIAGNLTQLFYNNTSNFACTGTHKIILNGTNEQKIFFASIGSYINELEFQNEKVTIITPVKIAKLVNDGKIKLESAGALAGIDLNENNLEVTGNVDILGDVKLCKGILNINGDVFHSKGTITADGTLIIEGDYLSGQRRMDEYGDEKIVTVNAGIIMDQEYSKINISGNYSNNSLTGTYTAGALTIGGNLEDCYDGNNFECSGTHTVTLNGENAQSVTIKGNSDTINSLIITKDISNYTFNPNPCWNSINYTFLSKFIITYDLGYDDQSFVYENVTEGEAIGTERMPKVPEREGYTFEGWYTQTEGKGEVVTSETIVDTDLIIYAYWKAVLKEYSITYDLGYDDQTFVYENITEGEAIGTERMPNVPEREGYTFAGWYTQTEGKGEAVTSETIINTALTIYAYWKPVEKEKIKIIFNFGEGYALYVTDEIAEGEIIGTERMPEIPEREGYAFVSWYTKTEGKGEEITAATKVTKSFTAYAYWKPVEKEDKDKLWILDIEPHEYTGKAIKPEIKVYYDSKLLDEKTDYTIKYSNNIKVSNKYAAKAPTVKVIGKGNYEGTALVKFDITQKDISDKDIILEFEDAYFYKAGKAQKINPVVKFASKTLKLGENKDYVIKCTDSNGAYINYKKIIDEGTYILTVTGVNNFTGSIQKEFTVGQKTILSKLNFGKLSNLSYTGNELTQKITIIDKTKKPAYTLVEGADYSVSFENNIDIGTACVYISSLSGSDYFGTKCLYFNITGTDIKNITVNNLPQKVSYTGNRIEPELDIYMKDTKLTKGADYELVYGENIKKGTGTVTIKGKGAYFGTVVKKFKIEAVSIENVVVKDANIVEEYTKGGAMPANLNLFYNDNKLVEGVDYKLSYKNNKTVSTSSDKTPVIIIKGCGNYKGSTSKEFVIVNKEFSNTNVTVSDVAYTGKAGIYTPKAVVYDTDDKILKAGTDYDKNVHYAYKYDTIVTNAVSELKEERQAGEAIQKDDIIDIGTVLVATVAPMGNYIGQPVNVEYSVVKYHINNTIVTNIVKEYTGKEIFLTEEEIQIYLKTGSQNRVFSSQFEIVPDSYRNNIKKGNATVTIRGIGDFGGTRVITFIIRPKTLFWFLK